VTVSIVEFLEARFNEDEEALKLVRQPYRLYIDSEGVISEPLTIESPWDDRQGEYEQWSDGEDRLPNRHTYWTLLYDAARALREVAAKRRVLARHCADTPPYVEYCRECENTRLDQCPELWDLAAPYSDHPDYREEWRP